MIVPRHRRIWQSRLAAPAAGCDHGSMNEFKLRRARLGAWVRWLNLPFMFWFASEMPMPLDKHLLILITVSKLVANLVFHVHLELTRRFLVSSYAMLTFEMLSTCVVLYATGLAVSPFLIIYPLHVFSVFFVDFNRRATLIFGALSMAAIVPTYLLWWHLGGASVVWNPRDYPGYLWSVCVIQILILSAYVFLATEANPLVEELDRREQVLLRQAHHAAVGTSVSMIAHELRNPLTSLGFSLERLGTAARLPGADPRLQKSARDAAEDLARIARMVQDLLAYARERRGRMQLEDHAPAALVERAVNFLALKQGRHRKSAVEADLAGAPMVRCDADAMHQVFVNIIENAIQHAVADRPLRVEIRHRTAGDRIALIVRDNGTGIAEWRLARVFEGFMTDRAEGTGLGLLISRHLMEDQGGGLELASTEGAGSTVTLLLPAGGLNPAPAAAGPADPGAPATAPD